MTEKTFTTPLGTIHYWTNAMPHGDRTLVFLPGLTADHHLFDKQVEFFKDKFPIVVWDAPAHGASRPFSLHFSLMDKAQWLHEILLQEKVLRPVLIGQSMGGYVAQCYLQRFPDEVAGFVSIDSAPLKRSYMTGIEIFLLKHIEPVYRLYPWRALLRDGARGCAEIAYGQALMREMMSRFEHREYCALAGHGYRMLAEAVSADLPYPIPCPALLICGEKDKAGSAKRYNRAWAKRENLPLRWIAGAGHNSNTDAPETVNHAILEFVEKL